jgi:uncharacterized membrane protein YphA (DoxX/SURF4 family)
MGTKMFFFFKRKFLEDLNKIGFLLVPLRLFIGIGWIRAGIEKFLNPSWSSGEALSKFLTENETFSPFYKFFIDDVFIPQASVFANLISFGQVLTGISIFSGTFTNIGLLIAIFMNLNFVLMGKTLPSAFYIIIQVELLLMDTGAMMGFDALLNKKIPYSFLTARPFKHGKNLTLEKLSYLVGMAFSFCLSFVGLSQVKHLNPHAVHDPEMIFFVMCVYMGFGFGLTLYRLRRGIRKEYRSMAKLQYGNQKCEVLTLDLSHGGISFLIPSSIENEIMDVGHMDIVLPDRISKDEIKLTGVLGYATTYGLINGKEFTRIGLIFSKSNQVKERTAKLMDSNIERILASRSSEDPKGKAVS